MKKIILLFFVLLLVVGCSDDDDAIKVNLIDFETISSSYPYSDLNPVQEFSYLELLQARPISEEENEEHILLSIGELCTEKNCKTAFQNLKVNNGFARGCLPDWCFQYLKIQTQNSNFTVASVEELIEFFGNIDTSGEALLLARASGYFWGVDDKPNGAIKETGEGFEVVVLQTVKFCTPYQINRYHLLIHTDGTITILEEEVAELDKNACV